MTEQQKRFCEALILTYGKQKEAAIMVGYSEKSADQKASDLMKNSEVREYYEQLRKDIIDTVKAKLTSGAELAVDESLRMLKDVEVSDKCKVDIIKILLEFAGLKPATKQELTGKDGTPLFSFAWEDGEDSG